MRVSFVVCSLLAATSASASPTTMDGPVADPCTLWTGNAGYACAKVASAKLGGVEAAVFLVGPDASAPAGQHSGTYSLAIATPKGWLVSHDGVTVPAYWREHGGGHNLIPTEPHLEALKLAGGRVAIAMDVPIHDFVTDCNDVASPKPAGFDIAACQRDAQAKLAAMLARVRRDRTVPASSPVALMACGARADGTWACEAPIVTGSSHEPIVRYTPDGRIPELGKDVPISF